MKKKMILAAWGTLLSLSVICAQNKPTWMPETAVDGKLQEWNGALRFYDKTSKMKYGFGNDDKYLYLAFEITDPESQMKLIHSGLNINLKTKVKPKTIGTLKLSGQKRGGEGMGMGLGPDQQRSGNRQQQTNQPEFQQMGANDQKDGQSQQRKGPNLDMVKQLYLLTKPTIETEGFIDSNEVIVAGEGGEMAFQVAWNEQNQLVIEARIPLKELFGAKYSLNKIAEKDIVMVVNQDQEQMPGGMSGGPEGGMGGRGGMGGPGGGMGGPGGGMGGPGGGMGGPGGGMGGPGGNMQTRSFEKVNIKNSIVLAVNP